MFFDGFAKPEESVVEPGLGLWLDFLEEKIEERLRIVVAAHTAEGLDLLAWLLHQFLVEDYVFQAEWS